MLAFKKAPDPKKAEFEKDLKGCVAALKECGKAKYFALYAAEKGLPSALEVKKEADRKISEFYGKHNTDGRLTSRVEDEMNSKGKPGIYLAVLSIFAGGYFLAKYVSREFCTFCVFAATLLLAKIVGPNKFLVQLVQRLRDIELEKEIEKIRRMGPNQAEERMERFRAWLKS